MVRLLRYFSLLLFALMALTACDPMAEKTITIELTNSPNALDQVKSELESTLKDLGFAKQDGNSSDHLMVASYAKIVPNDRGRSTTISVLLYCDARSRKITVRIIQAISWSLTDEARSAIENLEIRLTDSGAVKAIREPKGGGTAY
jgi:hypothetical protein